MECQQTRRFTPDIWPIQAVTLALFLAVFQSPTPSHAATAALPEFQQMRAHYRAVTTGKSDADSVAAQFEQWHQQHPTEALIELYRGALNCLVARDAWFPWNKMRYANRCMDQMDQSLLSLEAKGQSADLLHAYIERGFVNSHLPSLFGRQDMAIEDFNAAQHMPQWLDLTDDERRLILERLAELQPSEQDA